MTADGSASERAQKISATLTTAGFKAPITDDIRGEIWLKIWGNVSFNPISALTHATLVDLCQFPLTRALCVEMMREAEVIATKLGVTFRVSIERRPVKRPDLTLTWPSAAGFFRLIEAGGDAEAEIKREGDPAAWAKTRPLLHAFCACLSQVLADPVDENGVSLV